MATSSHGGTDQGKSPLLTLPPELRNRIYCFTLVQNERISITQLTSLPSEPGILSVNKQIREEAADIYYKENTFTFYISDHDPSVRLKWYMRSAQHERSRQSLKFMLSKNWKKILGWLEAYHCNTWPRPRLSSGPERAPEFLVPHHFFDIVQRLAGEDLEWEKIESNLESVHQVLMATDPAWA